MVRAIRSSVRLRWALIFQRALISPVESGPVCSLACKAWRIRFGPLSRRHLHYVLIGDSLLGLRVSLYLVLLSMGSSVLLGEGNHLICISGTLISFFKSTVDVERGVEVHLSSGIVDLDHFVSKEDVGRGESNHGKIGSQFRIHGSFGYFIFFILVVVIIIA